MIPFEFKHVEMSHESFSGRHVEIKYFIKVVIKRNLSDIAAQRVIWVHNPTESESESERVGSGGCNLEIGIEDQIHLNFISPKLKYSLNDFLIGQVNFSLVNIMIKSVDLSIVRRECVGDRITNQQVLQKYQIIDASPLKNDRIPFKVPLKNLKDLTPTYKQVEKACSLQYFVNLIIYDCEGRRFFKQQEIELYREVEKEKDQQQQHNQDQESRVNNKLVPLHLL